MPAALPQPVSLTVKSQKRHEDDVRLHDFTMGWLQVTKCTLFHFGLVVPFHEDHDARLNAGDRKSHGNACLEKVIQNIPNLKLIPERPVTAHDMADLRLYLLKEQAAGFFKVLFAAFDPLA